ncbi:hypothetical protein AB1Y20_016461 [Prymnesium parvum]|uniref:2Fe-2S ferredoxin-type domain-containing protein n=1 Tax=Prymnesium parvum TaxID=97485 RepID=A0AB34IDD6_PRYPA
MLPLRVQSFSRLLRHTCQSAPPLRPRLRPLHATAARLHGDYEWEDPKSADEVVRLHVVTRDGTRREVAGKVGDNLLYLCHRLRKTHPDITLEGACEASLACSTCHVIVSEKYFDMLPEPCEEEEDMLDEATCLTSTSRLGCQIKLTRALDGIEVTLPPYSRNYYVDGHVPEPH